MRLLAILALAALALVEGCGRVGELERPSLQAVDR